MFLVKLILKCGSGRLRGLKPWCKVMHDYLLRIILPFQWLFFSENPELSIFHFLVNILTHRRGKQVVVSLLYKLERGPNYYLLSGLKFKTKQNDDLKKKKVLLTFKAVLFFQKTISYIVLTVFFFFFLNLLMFQKGKLIEIAKITFS